MGIRFSCPNGHKLHVKTFLAGKRGVCPQCGVKIEIPTADAPQRDAALPANVPPPLPQPPSSPQAADLGSQSIVISVADPTMADSTPIDASPPVSAAPMQQLPDTAHANSAISPSPPPIVPEAIEPISPAARYTAQRERHRRTQFTVAILLLIAVLALAGVLIWVLSGGIGPAPTSQSAVTSAQAPSTMNTNRTDCPRINSMEQDAIS